MTYINRDTVISKTYSITEEVINDCKNEFFIAFVEAFRKLFIEQLKEFNPADVVPVRHGKWEDSQAINSINPVTLDFEICDTYRCSVCSEDFQKTQRKYKYCPNCGAKMDIENEQKISFLNKHINMEVEHE